MLKLALHTIVLLLLLRCVWHTNTLTLEFDEETNSGITLTCKDGLNSVEATFLHGETPVATDTSNYTFTINSTTEGEYTCSNDGVMSNGIVLVSKSVYYDTTKQQALSAINTVIWARCHIHNVTL